MKRLATIALAFASMCVLPSEAQNYPSKPIRIIVPTAPGLGVDQVARQMQARLAEDLGQPIVIVNQAGANGVIGTEVVARASGDGYTMVLATPSMTIAAQLLMKNLPYDPIKDLAPISIVVEPVYAFLVNSAVPANNMKEFIDWVKRNPEKATYGSFGTGSVFHMFGELFNQAAGVQMTHVPYKSAPPAVTAVVAGEISMSYAAMANALPQHRGGKAKILATLERNRFGKAPDIPTINETFPAFEKPPTWFGYFAPGTTPRSLVMRLNAAIVKSLSFPDVRIPLEDSALAVIGNTPEQFAVQFQSAYAIYAKAIQFAGLKPE